MKQENSEIQQKALTDGLDHYNFHLISANVSLNFELKIEITQAKIIQNNKALFSLPVLNEY